MNYRPDQHIQQEMQLRKEMQARNLDFKEFEEETRQGAIRVYPQQSIEKYTFLAYQKKLESILKKERIFEN